MITTRLLESEDGVELPPPVWDNSLVHKLVQALADAHKEVMAPLVEQPHLWNQQPMELSQVQVGEPLCVAFYPNLVSPELPTKPYWCELLVSALHEQFCRDIHNPQQVLKWRDPERYLLREQQTTLARYYRKLLSYTISDNVARDLAQTVELRRQPLELVTCQTAEDYIEMFKVNTFSCMNAAKLSSEYKTALWDEALSKGVFMSCWYHYNPHTQGVFLRRAGVPVARAMLVRGNSAESFTSFTNIKAVTSPFYMEMERQLKERGLMRLSSDYIVISETFEVPAVELSGRLYAPVAHCDEVYKPFSVRFLQDKRVFEFGPKEVLQSWGEGIIINNTYTHKGYIREDLWKY